MSNIDETTVVNKLLPKSWKCPHCKRNNGFSNMANDIFMKNFKFVAQCENCGNLHFWGLVLTADFKNSVAQMLKGGAE